MAISKITARNLSEQRLYQNQCSWTTTNVVNDLLECNFQEYPNEVACLFVFYWFAKMFLHRRPVRVKFRLDHHQIVLLKNLLFFELRDFCGLSNKRRRGGILSSTESAYDMLHIYGFENES